MSITSRLIAEFVSDIWQLVVGRPTKTTPELPETDPSWRFGCVQVTGAWRGTVSVTIPPELVETLAAAVHGMPADRVGEADRAEAVGELVSMIAGNLKAVLPPPCYLSRPVVAVGDGRESEEEIPWRRVLRHGFVDEGGEFVVTVAETDDAAVDFGPNGRRRLPERPSSVNPLSDFEQSGRFPQVTPEQLAAVPTPIPARVGDPLR